MDRRIREEISNLREMRGILQDLFRTAPAKEKVETLKTVREFDHRIVELEAKLKRTAPSVTVIS
jgi:hypothetical protein